MKRTMKLSLVILRHPFQSGCYAICCCSMAAVYMIWAYRDVANGVKREKLPDQESFDRFQEKISIPKST